MLLGRSAWEPSLGAGVAGQTWQGPKLHAGHPYACSAHGVLRSTETESNFILPLLGPKPPVNSGSFLSICSDAPCASSPLS